MVIGLNGERLLSGKESVKDVSVLGGFPRCPNCGREVLIPFSGYGGKAGKIEYRVSKTFAHWVCIKCGFYIGTGSKAASNLASDLDVKIIKEIREK